jgi:hypothetical protein
MSLFSIFVDFAGGTYVSQVAADDQNLALMQWFAKTQDEQAAGEDRHLFIKPVKQDTDVDLTKLDGLTNIWCTCFHHDDKLVLIHVVKTLA